MLISTLKLFLLSRYLSFCHAFLIMQEKRLDQKDKVNFRINGITALLTNNQNTHIAQCLRKKDNQTMKLDELIEYTQKNISSKIMQKMRLGDQFQTSFQYILIALNLPYNKNKLIKLQTIDLEICSILIFQKRVWEQFLYPILCMIFQEKCF